MQITSKIQAKTAASALRREIKAFNKAPEKLSHTDCLELMAKALGHSSWNAWTASLTDSIKAPTLTAVDKYPLRHKGEFDFVAKDEDGQPFSGSLQLLTGTLEKLVGEAGMISTKRGGDDGESLVVDYEGSTEVFWNAQCTKVNAQGHNIWLDDDGNEFSAAQLVIAPEGCTSPYDDEELPIRPSLLQAYLGYFSDKQLDARSLNGNFDDAGVIIGYTLTLKESAELQAMVQAA